MNKNQYIWTIDEKTGKIIDDFNAGNSTLPQASLIPSTPNLLRLVRIDYSAYYFSRDLSEGCISHTDWSNIIFLQNISQPLQNQDFFTKMKVETSFLGGFKLFKNDNIIIGENLGDLRFSLKMMQTV